MRLFRQLFFLLTWMMFFFFCFSCSLDGKKNVTVKNEISLVSWNVQTFFDSETDGCEYSDFRKGGNWNREKYSARLDRICEVIDSLNADVFVLIEIENEGVLQDISNHFAGGSWKNKDFWKYSCFSKPKDSSIGIGILSRYEMSDLSVHYVDLRNMKTESPSMRYLLQVTVNVGEKDFVLFANHWKSMSEGETETELWRDWQESVLASRLIELSNGGFEPSVVICGDFNRDIQKFVVTNGDILLRCAGFGKEKTINVSCPWISENGNFITEIGSYYYNDEWERIDNIFFNEKIELTYFEPVARIPWATDGKKPFSYKIFSGEGYSDHLPLMCRFKIE